MMHILAIIGVVAIGICVICALAFGALYVLANMMSDAG